MNINYVIYLVFLVVLAVLVFVINTHISSVVVAIVAFTFGCIFTLRETKPFRTNDDDFTNRMMDHQ